MKSLKGTFPVAGLNNQNLVVSCTVSFCYYTWPDNLEIDHHLVYPKFKISLAIIRRWSRTNV